jgi:hypothetical protein
MTTNTNVAVPAHIAARITARKAAGTTSAIMSSVLSGSDAFPYPRISIKAGRFRLIEDGVETPVGINLSVVIVGANPRVSKVFYAAAYDGNADGVRPSCLSYDGIKPDASVDNPISPSCSTCPHNVLGSKITPSGAKSKLCADQRHLAVVPAADPNKVYSLVIPVSAMANLREYFKELQNFGANPEEVVTDLGFDDKVSFPKVTFARKGFAPEAALARLDALAASDEVKEVVRAIPLKSAGLALAAPAATPSLAAPAPAVDDAYAEEAEAAISVPPAKSAGKPKSEPVKATSALEAKLDSLFSE